MCVFIYWTDYVSECWSKNDEYTVLDDVYIYMGRSMFVNVGVRMMSTLYLMMYLYLGPRYVSEWWSKEDKYTVLDDVFIFRTEICK